MPNAERPGYRVSHRYRGSGMQGVQPIRLVGLLVGWRVGLFVGWLVGLFVCWLVGWLVGYLLVNWFVGLFVGWLIFWLLVGRLVG